MKPRFSVFGTSGCHLCEAAEQAMVQAMAHTPDVRWRTIDIADDASLLTRYSETIPVVRDERSGAELCWPFGTAEIRALLTVPTDPTPNLGSSKP